QTLHKRTVLTTWLNHPDGGRDTHTIQNINGIANFIDTLLSSQKTDTQTETVTNLHQVIASTST
ncbi:MAG TPA: hypothetical protein VGS97_26735, partial [Actinocrinis sp.]|uniref:hypothetical protein n=1 Tax=Actinocrinis sp. TaxID=1920516 RepID=UPI002DDD5CC3